MEDFSHRGKVVEFWQVTGEVIGSEKYSETHVSSSGGGGYVGKGGGHVSAPTIHSSTVTNHEFWIRTEEGLEKSVKLHGVDIPLRQGQKITLISAGIKGKGSGWHSVLVNHNASRYWFINDAEKLKERMSLDRLTGKTLLIAAIIIFVIVRLTAPEFGSGRRWDDASWGWAIGVAAIFVIYRIVVRSRRELELLKRLKIHLENLALSHIKRVEG